VNGKLERGGVREEKVFFFTKVGGIAALRRCSTSLDLMNIIL